MLDIDGALKFLALDEAVINNDGYWTRGSDYSVYKDAKGIFHVVPWDANETFREPERMGPRGVEQVDGVALDPFTGSNDPNKALFRLLSVPSLRAKYLGYLRDIAETWFDWRKTGPMLEQWHSLIADDVKADTRKLFSTDAFAKSLTVDHVETGFGPTSGPDLSLKSFLDRRHEYLLNHPDIRQSARQR